MTAPLSPAERLSDALELKAKAIEEAEKDLDVLREQRRTLMLEASDHLTYVQIGKAAGVSKPQVYKILRGGFGQPALREQAAAAAASA